MLHVLTFLALLTPSPVLHMADASPASGPGQQANNLMALGECKDALYELPSGAIQCIPNRAHGLKEAAERNERELCLLRHECS